MFVIFVAVMTIIVNNLLTGLTVDDVQTVQETAVLQRQALKIKLALESIYQVPHSLRYRWYRDQISEKLTLDKKSFLTYLSITITEVVILLSDPKLTGYQTTGTLVVRFSLK